MELTSFKSAGQASGLETGEEMIRRHLEAEFLLPQGASAFSLQSSTDWTRPTPLDGGASA